MALALLPAHPTINPHEEVASTTTAVALAATAGT
jgi:hypothetical protein